MIDLRKNHLADSAEMDFRKAQKLFISELQTIFKVGTVWKCFHGSSLGYYVVIASVCEGYANIGHVIVVNKSTNKAKKVSIYDLQEVTE